jgi:hypothetical protein
MIQTVMCSIDTQAFVAKVLRLAELLELLDERVNGVIGILQSTPDVFGVIVRDDAAGGARDIRVRLDPSDRLCELVATFEALERELSVLEVLRHG